MAVIPRSPKRRPGIGIPLKKDGGESYIRERERERGERESKNRAKLAET
jgi:hypothetical protein